MRKQLLLLLFSLFAVVGFARTVTGVVTQKSDNLPIIGATVMVEGRSVAQLPTLMEDTLLTFRIMMS